MTTQAKTIKEIRDRLAQDLEKRKQQKAKAQIKMAWHSWDTYISQ